MELLKICKPFTKYSYRFQFFIKNSIPKSQKYLFSTKSCEGEKNVENEENQHHLVPVSKEMIFNKMNSLVPKRKEISFDVEEKDKEMVQSLKADNILYPYKTPFERGSDLLVKDIKNGCGRIAQFITGVDFGFRELKEFFPRHTDILVIGSGPLGLTIAYELKKTFLNGPRVTLLDSNHVISHEITNLGQGIIWQQNFTEEEEIQMAQYFVEFIRGFKRHTYMQGKPEFTVSYEPMGSLFLADKNNSDKMLLKSETMKKYKVQHKLISNDKLEKQFSWLNTSDVVFGSLGLCDEGLIDPWTYVNGIRCKAVNLGVDFVTGSAISFAKKELRVNKIICRLPDGTYNSIEFCFLVLATGLETLNLVKLYNDSGFSEFKINLPLVEKRKYEFCFYNPEGPGMNTPIVVDTDGTYFRREGLCGYYVVGVPSIDCDGDEKNGVAAVFKNRVEPFLRKRIPDFENYKLCSGWIDNYTTNSANEVGLIGAHHNEMNTFYANGFQHLGLQQIPAVARAIAERIYYEKYMTINFSKFHIENMYLRQHLEAERKQKEEIEARKRVALTG